MKNPTTKDCHPDNCSNNEQQLARIVRLWVRNPDGAFDSHQSNLQRLCSALEYRIQGWLNYSPDMSIHEFWSDGIHLRLARGNTSTVHFAGTAIYSDRHGNHMWLAPFDIRIGYANEETEWPASLHLRFGIPDPDTRIARIEPRSWKTWRAEGEELFQTMPTTDNGWAIFLDLDPFPDCPDVLS